MSTLLCNMHFEKQFYVFHEGLNVTEIAHDIHTPVSSYVTRELGLVNSYDTWHGKTWNIILIVFILHVYLFQGTKNVAKEMSKITKGPVKTRGITWFPELADKSKIIIIVYIIMSSMCNTIKFINSGRSTKEGEHRQQRQKPWPRNRGYCEASLYPLGW